MDSLQVTQQQHFSLASSPVSGQHQQHQQQLSAPSLGIGGSNRSSRAPSPCRSSEAMPKEDEGVNRSNMTTTDSISVNSGGSAARARKQSPATNRRSRERDRMERTLPKETEMHLPQSELYSDVSKLLSLDDSQQQHEGLDGGHEAPLFYPNQSQNQSQTLPPQQPYQYAPTTGHSRTNSSSQALDRLNTKIACTKESIRKEQTARDDNVNEYLKLAANADKQQLQRIKAVFEKKNQKSAHSISQLQKKLESYSKRVDVQLSSFAQQQGQHRQPREVLRDVGQGLKNVGGNIRDGITGLGGSVMSKPREFAHLIKNKFGSADNINQLSSNPELNTLNLSGMEGAGTSTPHAGGIATSTGSGGANGKFNSENDSECSSVTSDSLPAGSGKNHSSSGVGGGGGATHSGGGSTALVLKTLITELQERREDCEKLRTKLERFEALQKEVADITLALESERYRAERLEEQINDASELHQNEIENLKQTMADMEEKVQYQSDERLRDVHEVLENCQTRITKMEHLSQQQYVTVEGIDNSNARALVVKLINVVLTVLQVVLLLVATAAGIIMPFLKTRIRVLTTLFFILFTIFVIRQWPDVRDIGSHMVRHLKESLVVK